MTLTTPAWASGGAIPLKYSQAGDEVSPPLMWSGVPEGTASFVLVVEDMANVRTGRATVGLLDNIHVEAYGARMPLNQVATVTIPEPRMISVQVWDRGNVQAVDRAIREANIGINPVVDGTLIRLPVPAPTAERRIELGKQAKKYAEQHRVAIRNVRHEGMELLKKLEKDHAISEDDLVRIMQHPATMIASDASPGMPIVGVGAPHPRAYGAFARVLGVYVREKHVLTLEQAIRKMTSFPAQRIGLRDRGVLRPGLKADIVVFNPSTIIDKATFESPHQYAEGVSAVLVNGRLTLSDGKMTGERAGRALRRN